MSYISWDKADLLFDYFKKKQKKTVFLKGKQVENGFLCLRWTWKLVQHYKENPKQSLFGFFSYYFPLMAVATLTPSKNQAETDQYFY